MAAVPGATCPHHRCSAIPEVHSHPSHPRTPAPTHLVQGAGQRDALLLPPRQVDALLPNLRVSARRQHGQVGSQAARLHTRVPPILLKRPPKGDVVAYCG
jgi:hypothetical protein